jgi:hypothetical protein
MLDGARERGLPDYYICTLERIETHHDLDAERHSREMALHELAEPLISGE